MPDAETLLNLQQDCAAVAEFIGEYEGGLDWRDARQGVYWVTFRPASAPGERYHARIAWESYPFAAPSVKFGDGIGGSLTVNSAWPSIAGYRTGSFDICRPMSKEGFESHPEWAQGSTSWVLDGNPFLWVVQQIQFHMDNDEYQGRAG